MNRKIYIAFVKVQICLVCMMLLIGLNACATQSAALSVNQSGGGVDIFSLSVDAQRAYQQSRWFDAVRLYQEIVEHVPGDSTAWFRLANTYAQQGAYEHAVHAYEQSLLHDNEQPKAWFNLSTAYLLHAQSAMQHSQAHLASGDPARELIQRRMRMLDDLVLGRIDSVAAPTASSFR